MVSRSQVFYELQVADVDTPDTIRPRCTETNRESRLNNAYTVTSIHSHSYLSGGYTWQSYPQ
jgi:hypothetical protein